MTRAPSKITNVHLYRQAALITRRASLPALPSSPIQIEPLPIHVEDSSIRVRLIEPSSGWIVQETQVLWALEVPPAPDTALQTAIQDKNLRLEILKAEIDLRQDERRQIEGLKPLPPAAPKEQPLAPMPPPPVKAGLALLSMVDERLQALDDDLFRLESEREKEAKALAQLHREQALSEEAWKASQRQPYKRLSIHLHRLSASEIHASQDPQTEGLVLEVSYRLPGAFWFPTYEVRFRDKGRLAEVILQAQIAQVTGETWEDVEVTLSTADLQRSTALPELKALRLGRSSPERSRAFRPPPVGTDLLFETWDAFQRSSPSRGPEGTTAGVLERTRREEEWKPRGEKAAPYELERGEPVHLDLLSSGEGKRETWEADATKLALGQPRPHPANVLAEQQSFNRPFSPPVTTSMTMAGSVRSDKGKAELQKNGPLSWGGGGSGSRGGQTEGSRLQESLLEGGAYLSQGLGGDGEVTEAYGDRLLQEKEQGEDGGGRSEGGDLGGEWADDGLLVSNETEKSVFFSERDTSVTRAGRRLGGKEPEEIGQTVGSWFDFASLRMAGVEELRRGRLLRLSTLAQIEEAGGDERSLTVIAVMQEKFFFKRAWILYRALPPHAQLVSQGVGHFDVAYEAKGRFSIPTDGQFHRITVRRGQAEAEIVYRSLPEFDPVVYREARLMQPFDLPLLPGPAHVFWEGDSLVTTPLSLVPEGGSLTIGLGPEEGIRIARHVAHREETKGLVSSQQSLFYDIRLEIRSYLGETARVEVIERVPVSSDKKTIKVVGEKTEPAAVVYDQQDRGKPVEGGRKWSLSVAPRGEARCRLHYEIQLPAKQQILQQNR